MLTLAHGASADFRTVGEMDFAAFTGDAFLIFTESLEPDIAAIAFFDIIHIVGDADATVA